MKQSCKTCTYAEWSLTKNGKIQFNKGGTCSYPIEVPECVIFTKGVIYQDNGRRCKMHRMRAMENRKPGRPPKSDNQADTSFLIDDKSYR